MSFFSTAPPPCRHPITKVHLAGKTAKCALCGWNRTFGVSGIVDAIGLIVESTKAEFELLREEARRGRPEG